MGDFKAGALAGEGCFVGSRPKFLEGSVVGVMPPENSDLRKPYDLSQGERLTIGPYTADHAEGTDLYKMPGRYVHGIADSMPVSRAQEVKPAPSH